MDLFPTDIVDLSAAGINTFIMPGMATRGIEAAMLRLDRIHPIVSGNKWFKLKYHLQEALRNGHDAIVTFGGAYSNHIVAAAYAARTAGLQSTGIIRGEAPATLSHTLRVARDHGMRLEFVSRDDYSRMTKQLSPLPAYTKHYCIPEGGAGELGEKGCREIPGLVDSEAYTHILCAVGTATMFLGLAHSLTAMQQLIGIPVLKGMNDLLEQLEQRIDSKRLSQCRIFADYHQGGYAKKNTDLFDFMNTFYQHTGIPTDFVYTGKLVFATSDLIEKNYFPAGSRLLLIHSGGLQGNLSLPVKTLRF
jgi:1-aminocyclopropane-1-carboxylate deaminase